MDKKFRGKTAHEYEAEMSDFCKQYTLWREAQHGKSVGFFPLFSNDIKPYLQTLSGNAVRLFAYLGVYSDNITGEVIRLSQLTITRFFECSPRTLQNWLAELEQAGLIKRLQTGFKDLGRIFLIPYNTMSHQMHEQSNKNSISVQLQQTE